MAVPVIQNKGLDISYYYTQIITRDEERHFIVAKASIHQEDKHGHMFGHMHLTIELKMLEAKT